MEKLSKKTVRILTKVKEHILEEPKRLDMDQFGEVYPKEDMPPGIPACRTLGCIAGWTVLLERPKIWKKLLAAAEVSEFSVEIYEELGGDWEEPSVQAEAILDLDSEQSGRLFYFKEWGVATDEDGAEIGWPEKFSEAYTVAKTARRRANIAAKRIDHFIATDGAE